MRPPWRPTRRCAACAVATRGEPYEAYLTKLAKESGIDTPTREDLAKLDKKRKKTTSNDDWEHPHDPDAKVTRMKDKCTHLAHKAEHVVDLDTQAIVAVSLADANEGDTSSMPWSLPRAESNQETVSEDLRAARKQHELFMAEVVAAKGYHSNEVLVDLRASHIRSHVSEPDRGRRKWKDKEEAQVAVYGNRRRIRSPRGQDLQKRRAEIVERGFAALLKSLRAFSEVLLSALGAQVPRFGVVIALLSRCHRTTLNGIA